MSTSATADAAPLDLHKAVSDAGARKAAPEGRSGSVDSACDRWPKAYWLVSDQGEMVRGRCRSSNRCAYCARLFAVETAEMLALDAMDGNAPRVWAVLTTRTATLDMPAFYRGREQVQRAVRRRYPGAEFAWFVEFTTGYGKRSGGKRRPHWNLLMKGVPDDDLAALHELVSRVWCQHADALPRGQHVAAISEAGGLMKYLALHFLKESQQPPAGWKGHRFTSTRGYFGKSRPETRGDARSALQLKRELWKLRDEPDATIRLEAAEAALAARSALTWRMVRYVTPATPEPDQRRWVYGTKPAPDGSGTRWLSIVRAPGIERASPGERTAVLEGRTHAELASRAAGAPATDARSTVGTQSA